MTAKEVTINYLKSIKKDYQGVLKAQLRGNASEKYLFDTMQYLVAIDIAIEAVEEGEGE